jgi:hypothetical protein
MDTLLFEIDHSKENEEQDRENISMDVANTILGITLNQYERIFCDKTDIDQKTGILLAGIGIIIGFVATRSISLNPAVMQFGIVILIISSISCMYELAIRKYHGINSDLFFDMMIERNQLMNPIQTKLDLIADITEYNNYNDNIYEKLVNSFYFVLITFIAGVILIFASYFYR